MADALTPLFAIAAGVLCVSGVWKLRSPAAAASALQRLGVPSGTTLIRCVALAELALGAWSVVRPGRADAAAVATAYAGFAVLSWLLARRRVPCGCFGERDERPASTAQSALSVALAATAAATAASPPHGLAWLAARPVVAVGVLGAVYAMVLAYTVLPAAWSAWAGSAG